MKEAIKLGVIGIDHGHIFDMLNEMIKEGCSCDCFWTEGNPLTLQEFNKKYPNIKRKENKEQILNDSSIDMILISSIPVDRAGHSIDALRAGKNVMVDKPGCTTLDQLNNLKNTVKECSNFVNIAISLEFKIERFFANVMVMDQDFSVRSNRLNICKYIHDWSQQFLDIRELSIRK